jgi:hypothetical protein
MAISTPCSGPRCSSLTAIRLLGITGPVPPSNLVAFERTIEAFDAFSIAWVADRRHRASRDPPSSTAPMKALSFVI